MGTTHIVFRMGRIVAVGTLLALAGCHGVPLAKPFAPPEPTSSWIPGYSQVEAYRSTDHFEFFRAKDQDGSSVFLFAGNSLVLDNRTMPGGCSVRIRDDSVETEYYLRSYSDTGSLTKEAAACGIAASNLRPAVFGKVVVQVAPTYGSGDAVLMRTGSGSNELLGILRVRTSLQGWKLLRTELAGPVGVPINVLGTVEGTSLTVSMTKTLHSKGPQPTSVTPSDGPASTDAEIHPYLNVWD